LKLLGLYLKRMFGFSLEGQVTLRAMDKLIMLGKTYWWLLIICIICCTPWPRKLVDRFYKNWICKVLLLAVFWFSVYQIAKGGSNPFLYFRF
jgi:alginate O-acetyltransferase complex protein AlgI